MSYQVTDLPYSYDALAPHFESSLLEIHHSKHHAGYVGKLNDLLAGEEALNWELDYLVANLDKLPADKQGAARKLAGQHYNHDLYWHSLAPKSEGGGNAPQGALGQKILEDFESYEVFKSKFAAASAAQFGSGWAWLSLQDGKLVISSSSNEESPLMHGASPLLTLDVWEHAYYLQYQNRRPDFISSFWEVVNWANAEKLYLAAK